jgi:hypothetical protein
MTTQMVIVRTTDLRRPLIPCYTQYKYFTDGSVLANRYWMGRKKRGWYKLMERHDVVRGASNVPGQR